MKIPFNSRFNLGGRVALATLPLGICLLTGCGNKAESAAVNAPADPQAAAMAAKRAVANDQASAQARLDAQNKGRAAVAAAQAKAGQ